MSSWLRDRVRSLLDNAAYDGVRLLIVAIVFPLVYATVQFLRRQSLQWTVLLVFIGLALLALALIGVSKLKARKKVKLRLAPAPLLKSQLEEITRLQEFLTARYESGLREIFDLPGIMRFNIKMTKRSLVPKSMSSTESDEIDEFFKGGQAIVNTKYCNVSRNAHGTPRVEWIPGRVGAVNVSLKHVTNRQRLSAFEESAQLPADVCIAVKELGQGVDDNIMLLLDVLNEKMTENPVHVVQDEGASPNLGATSNVYLSRFIQLKPKQEKVIAAIREYLDVR
jgi:hypothetical protein